MIHSKRSEGFHGIINQIFLFNTYSSLSLEDFVTNVCENAPWIFSTTQIREKANEFLNDKKHRA